MQLITNDQIDVLIDCAGHSKGNRLPLLARKPAPISVTFLGSPGTTGLNSIGYRFTDSFADPPKEGNVFSTEKLVRLPNGFLTYMPLIEMPAVAPVPFLKTGIVTFGSLNNRLKLNDSVIRPWAEILLSVPLSRLILKDRCFSFPAMVDDMRQRFSNHGITPDRIDIRAYDASINDHFQIFKEVDIALDPFPYNGTTSTCDALYMGVPVVSLLGDSYIGRMTTMILSRCGLTEYVAKNALDYVRIASGLARDLEKLQSLRLNLREMLQTSTLGTPKLVARDMEHFYSAAVRGESLPFVYT